MSPQIGVESLTKPAVKVFVESCQGGRKYMEDCHCVAYQEKARKHTLGNKLEYVYFGVFDGHGGKEAAIFTKEHLLYNIVSQRTFWSNDDNDVCEAIKEGFIATHYAMMKEVGKWPKTSLGLPSTSGTTASVCFLMHDKYYIGHVGDSRIVLVREEDQTAWNSVSLTKDHKPDTPSERNRIINAGGKVMNKSGVERVVWNRPKCGHKGPVRRSTHIDEIPFLAVARSLGDLWSYNSASDTFIVSPVPDVTVLPVSTKDVCILLASDGLWNMIGERESVQLLYEFYESSTENTPLGYELENDDKNTWNPAQLLVESALQCWNSSNLRADNISVVVGFFNRNISKNNCERNNEDFDEFLTLNPTIIPTNSGGEYFIPKTERLQRIFTDDKDDFLVKSDEKTESASRFSCEYTHLKYNSRVDTVEALNSSLCTLEPFQIPLQTINDNEFNCKQESFEALQDLKSSRNRVESGESNSVMDSLLNSENNISDVCVNRNESSENNRVHLCENDCQDRRVRTKLILQTSLRGSFHSGRVNKRKWKKLSNSPPAKRLRSSSWSRAKISFPSLLPRALAASLLTRSRLRAIKCAAKPF